MNVEREVPSSGVVERIVYRGAQAAARAAADLVIEIPHGATRTSEYVALHAQLRGMFPDGLEDFFHVNTDAGAPELAEALATRLVTTAPRRTVEILRCRIPRTFIDCNRDITADPAAFREGRVTPGVPPYVKDPEDLALLHRLYAAWRDVVGASFAAACGASGGPGGRALMLHTYAPRSVEVEVDADIVAALHQAYLPDIWPRWPLRPEVDLIGRTLAGGLVVDPALVAALVRAFAGVDVTMAVGETYPLHPSTLAFGAAAAYPGRTLCLEVRRDLLAAPFTPFAEMIISPASTERLAAPLATVMEGWLSGDYGPWS